MREIEFSGALEPFAAIAEQWVRDAIKPGRTRCVITAPDGTEQEVEVLEVKWSVDDAGPMIEATARVAKPLDRVFNTVRIG